MENLLPLKLIGLRIKHQNDHFAILSEKFSLRSVVLTPTTTSLAVNQSGPDLVAICEMHSACLGAAVLMDSFPSSNPG